MRKCVRVLVIIKRRAHWKPSGLLLHRGAQSWAHAAIEYILSVVDRRPGCTYSRRRYHYRSVIHRGTPTSGFLLADCNTPSACMTSIGNVWLARRIAWSRAPLCSSPPHRDQILCITVQHFLRDCQIFENITFRNPILQGNFKPLERQHRVSIVHNINPRPVITRQFMLSFWPSVMFSAPR